MKMRKITMSEKTYKVKAFALDDNGKGIVRIDSKTLFVNNLLEDEEGEITTIFKFGKLIEAKLVKRLTDRKSVV